MSVFGYQDCLVVSVLGYRDCLLLLQKCRSFVNKKMLMPTLHAFSSFVHVYWMGTISSFFSFWHGKIQGAQRYQLVQRSTLGALVPFGALAAATPLEVITGS